MWSITRIEFTKRFCCHSPFSNPSRRRPIGHRHSASQTVPSRHPVPGRSSSGETRKSHVYKNSFITFAAQEAEDSNQGIFCDRLPRIWPLDFSGQSISGETGVNRPIGIRLRRKGPEKIGTFSDRSSCLDNRAWAFQERILRTIHIIAEILQIEMTWECNSSMRYEHDLPTTGL